MSASKAQDPSSSSGDSNNSHEQKQHKELSPKKSTLHKQLPPSMVPETHVAIIGITKEEDTVKYGILVQTLQEEYIVYRRYSEFKCFRDVLIQAMTTNSGCGDGPCRLLFGIKEYYFPRRRIQFRYRYDHGVVQERILRLEYFLRIVLNEFKGVSKRNFDRCLQGNCQVLNLLRAFLKLDGFSEPLAMENATTLVAQKQVQLIALHYDQVSAKETDIKDHILAQPQLFQVRRKPKRDSPPVTIPLKPIARLQKKGLYYQSALYPIQENFEMMFIRRCRVGVATNSA